MTNPTHAALVALRRIADHVERFKERSDPFLIQQTAEAALAQPGAGESAGAGPGVYLGVKHVCAECQEPLRMIPVCKRCDRPQEPLLCPLCGKVANDVLGVCSHAFHAPGPAPAEHVADVSDGGFGQAAYCHHRHHLDEHSSDFDTCPHSICVGARRAGPAPAVVTQEQIEALQPPANHGPDQTRHHWESFIDGYELALEDVLALFRPEAPAERAQEQKL